tara:strand:+ start:25871 stop:26200 length:330 start_codon:yes stop_codon:yes gene_type:complete
MYDLNRLDEWIFYVKTSMVIPHEHISINKDLVLEVGEYFHIFNGGGQNIHKYYVIEIFGRLGYISFTVSSTIQTILYNSDLNKEHPDPLFIESKKMYERNEIINEILEI